MEKSFKDTPKFGNWKNKTKLVLEYEKEQLGNHVLEPWEQGCQPLDTAPQVDHQTEQTASCRVALRKGSESHDVSAASANLGNQP